MPFFKLHESIDNIFLPDHGEFRRKDGLFEFPADETLLMALTKAGIPYENVEPPKPKPAPKAEPKPVEKPAEKPVEKPAEPKTEA